jgi:hypothetical protein
MPDTIDIQTGWTARHVNPAYVIPEFAVTEDNTTKTGQQFCDDIRFMSDDMPHAYATLTITIVSKLLVFPNC